MNRYSLYIMASIFAILFPIAVLLYGLWDMDRPTVGVDRPNRGLSGLSTFQVVILGSLFISGILNLIIAVKRFKDNYKK
ncbi:hypothetical protein ACFQZE_08915 [Paenibacillus sp. GCM10027627]|uniref:hypothetical protein n=1 Tax=unclassified Paenibacillus TaxID=185978 RepID=UPI00363F2006